MPIRKFTLHASIVGVMLTSSTLASADSASWSGSYAADGSCYCAESLGRYIDSRITPTPIGGQSIAQVCERIGAGPKLQKVNGKFNFTVYPDAQCGHGPSMEASADSACLGHKGVSGEDCATKGPKWDLSAAYSADAKPKAIKAESTISESTEVAVTGGSRYIKPPVSKSQTSVADIANAREGSTYIKPSKVKPNKVVEATPAKVTVAKPRQVAKAVPQTPEQIRARQLEHLAAARERAAQRDAQRIAATPEPKPAKIKQPVIKKESVEIVVDNSAVKTPSVSDTTTIPALKVPAVITNNDTHDFDYVEGAPVNYDFGGAGLSLAASKSSHNRVQYLLNVAAADSYSEAAVGVGVFFKPVEFDRLTFMLSAGVEHGQFNFKRDELKADLSDTGAFLKLASRFVVTRQFELQAGVGYSSFFEGDAIGFGAAFYHLTPQLDLTAKAEAGDNDLLGFGFRFHY